ncbi:hypothetical protein FQN57_002869 [Myotisia sp. PD_48]|nr:hypothetical protein FQN57_002869 [Myotisia sp. PD_48]
MMMAADPLNELDNIFDDHPSLSASLEDFEEHASPRSPLFNIPSQHSGFKSGISETASDDGHGAASRSSSPWSPPGFKREYMQHLQSRDQSEHHRHPALMVGAAWYRQQPYLRNQPDFRPHQKAPSYTSTREPSPQYEDALEKPPIKEDIADLILPASIPLPPGTDSPLKGRSPSPEPTKMDDNDWNTDKGEPTSPDDQTPSSITNYIRFAVRAEVQHREPFVAFFNYIGAKIDSMTQTRLTTLVSITIGLVCATFLRVLFLPPTQLPVPDIVKLSSFARSFEPLIYYSENGVQQIGTLQETGVAVWDLAESVRATNMTSAPILVRALDELSDSLKTLSLELTRFFANVDSDIDSILIVMEWARRELDALSSQPGSSLPSILFDNLHGILSRLGALETVPNTQANEDGGGITIPTRLGSIVTAVFGRTRSHHTQLTISHAFHELLSVLEESINSELTHSSALFALFESIDRQFLNIQRTVVRESNTQERAEEELLSSLWTRVLGANAEALRKYEKNRSLLRSVRQRTVANKHLLMDHRGRLLALKVNLEALRRKLVSPLLRGGNSSLGLGLGGTGSPLVGSGSSASVSGGDALTNIGSNPLNTIENVIQGQIRGLDGAYDYLKDIRERQKAKLMDMVYGAGSRRSDPLVDEIDGQ